MLFACDEQKKLGNDIVVAQSCISYSIRGGMMMILVLGQLLYHYPKLSAQHRLVIPSVRGIREVRVL